MLFRRVLLVFGVLALVAGVTLSLFWLRAPVARPIAAEPPTKVTGQSVLVAAKDLPVGTLLRVEDMRWHSHEGELPPGAIRRGQLQPDEYFGAVILRDFARDEPLVADQIIKPSEAAFLPAVLKPGHRAVSIAVGANDGTAALITPGDFVDVILTQLFNSEQVQPGQRSVAETVIRDLRVVAIDQAIAPATKPRSGEPPLSRQGQPVLPKTVTLEASPSDSESLMVAAQLGRIHLALRGRAEPDETRVASRRPNPTWASEVSPALKQLKREQPGNKAEKPAPANPARFAVEVVRGGQSSWRCFDRRGRSTADCGNLPEVARPVAPAPPAAAAAPAPAPNS